MEKLLTRRKEEKNKLKKGNKECERRETKA